MPRTLCFDFDGVLHSYTSGWRGHGEIPDPPVPGMSEAIWRLQSLGWECVISSSRARTAEGQRAIRQWLVDHDFPPMPVYEFKPPAEIYIDDRALRFDGCPASMLQAIDAWTGPWNLGAK